MVPVILMADHALEILYSDEHYIAINKPPGLLVHASIIDRHETENALEVLQQQVGKPLYMIHRLDKPTSGVLLFGLSSEAARRGVDLFTRSDLRKTYLAVVRGYTEAAQVIDSPLKQVQDKMMAGREKQNKAPQAALTSIRRLATVELPVAVGRYATARYSLVEAFPQTGRMHQVRRHLKHIRHPVIGDTRYGDPLHNRYFREHWDAQRLLLAAAELEWIHPFTKERLRISAPLDDVYQSVLADLEWISVIPETWLQSSNQSQL